MKQVNKNHYEFEKYLHIKRWSSYWYQITEILKTEPKSVLDIGVVNNVSKSILEEYGIRYYKADIDVELNPNYLIDSIDTFKINKKFDTVCAFQVLEHLEYSKFVSSLANLGAHSKKYVLISLPYFSFNIHLKISIPFFNMDYLFRLPIKKKLVHPEHLWEINRNGYNLKRIRKDILKVFKINKEFTCKQHPYHYFFILEK